MYHRTKEELANIVANIKEVVTRRDKFENRITFELLHRSNEEQVSSWEVEFIDENEEVRKIEVIIDDSRLEEDTLDCLLKNLASEVSYFNDKFSGELIEESKISDDVDYVVVLVEDLKELFGEYYYNEFQFIYIKNHEMG